MHAFPDPLTNGPQLHSWRTRQWIDDHDLARPLVVLVHGIGSDSQQFTSIANYLENHFAVAVYNYASHEGIDLGARGLSVRLERFAPRLAKTGFALIGHNTGGFVAKYFARHAAESLRPAVAGLATLGTPHNGLFQGQVGASRKQLVAMILSLFERDDLVDPYALSTVSEAGRQLLGDDAVDIVGELLRADRMNPFRIPTLTVSGGQDRIDAFKRGDVNTQFNDMLRETMSLPNDGVVEETSADLAALLQGCSHACRHHNDYLAWEITNHLHLQTNQSVAELLLDWLLMRVFKASARRSD
jgi:pimeloyl-ACP methyl ester carboxylesterase